MEFEPTIPASERANIVHALDRSAQAWMFGVCVCVCVCVRARARACVRARAFVCVCVQVEALRRADHPPKESYRISTL
jgi:hypothetical protein